MWIVKKDSGTYYQDRIEVNGKSKYVSVKIAKNTKDGRADARLKLERKIDKMTSDRLRFSGLVDLYLKEQELSLKPSTVCRNRASLGRVCDMLSDPLCDDLRAGDIRKALLNTGKGATSLNEYLKRIRALLKWGYQNDYIKSYDVIAKLQNFPAPPHKLSIVNKFLEPREIELLLADLEPARWRLLTEFLVLSGLRVGEALALNKTDVKGGYIHVSKTLDLATKEITEPKTIASNRDVFIQEQLAPVIDDINREMAEQQRIYGYPPTVYFFTGITGNRIGYDKFNRVLTETSQRVLHRKVTAHTLRHTHASLLAAQGVDLETIVRRLGHENSKVTREVYLHQTEQLKKRDAEQVKNVHLFG